MIKILIGGSPCTHWSIAQKNNRETKAEGLGWELFRNYLIAKEKFKPDYYLYENNKSAAKAIKQQIAKELDRPLQYINSALVSAQNRQRFYVHNIEGVNQPEDRGVLLKDIIEHGSAFNEKSFALTTRCGGAIPEDTLKRHRHTMIAEPVIFQRPRGYNKGGAKYEKAPTLTANGYWEHNNHVIEPFLFSGKPVRIGDIPSKGGKISGSQANRVYSINGKSVNLVANGGGGGAKTGLYAVPINNKPSAKLKQSDRLHKVVGGQIEFRGIKYPIKLLDGYYIIRKLTVKECCRLQTLPDNYCDSVSNTQGYRGLGNGWTAEVIIHILSHLNIPKDEEIVVLSIYDGIGTGRYCFDKLGYTNVKYYAYEIDKYAKQIAMTNYPDIIQMGDAFQVRENDWDILKT